MMNTELSIEGMTCNGCVEGLKRALTPIEGVRAVKVSLADKKASVEHDEGVLPAVLIQAVSAVGFSATLIV